VSVVKHHRHHAGLSCRTCCKGMGRVSVILVAEQLVDIYDGL